MRKIYCSCCEKELLTRDTVDVRNKIKCKKREENLPTRKREEKIRKRIVAIRYERKLETKKIREWE